MKKTILVTPLLLIIIGASLFAQTAASPYVFPDFVDATVLQKNGAKMQAQMNYQKVTEEMLFIQDGKKIVLGNTDVIDTIYIGGRKFIPARAVFLEKLTNTPVALYAAHKAKLVSPNSKSDNNRVDNGNNKKSISDLDVYQIKYPAGYEVRDQLNYWINHGMEFIPVSDLKKISKAYPKQSGGLTAFIEDNKINLSNQEDLVKLVTFLSK